MAVVIKNFRERYHNFKRYNVGEVYPEDNQQRVQFLIEQGFLKSEETNEPPTFDEFLGMSAADQKKVLSDLSIEGDDSNEEKRSALYKQFLGLGVGVNEHDQGVTDDGNTNS